MKLRGVIGQALMRLTRITINEFPDAAITVQSSDDPARHNAIVLYTDRIYRTTGTTWRPKP